MLHLHPPQRWQSSKEIKAILPPIILPMLNVNDQMVPDDCDL